MKRAIHPAIFLGTVVAFCAVWLWLRPPPIIDLTAPHAGTRPVRVERTSIALDPAILGRYAGKYEGRGDFRVDLTLEGGKLFAESPGVMPPVEVRAESETEFFLDKMGYDVEFDVGRDGTVRGFDVDTEYGLIRLTRLR